MEEISQKMNWVRKKLLGITLLLLISVGIQGCSPVEKVSEQVSTFILEKRMEGYKDKFPPVPQEALLASANDITPMLYAYSQLSDTEKQLYTELYTIISQYYTEDQRITADSEDMIEKVYQAIKMDHPEIFYARGYTITTHKIKDQVVFYSFLPNYIYNEDEVEIKKKQIMKASSDILEQIPEDATDYEKVKFVYEYIVINTDYDEMASDNQNIISVLLNHASVCQGYAYAMQFLLNELGVECTTVYGDSIEEGKVESHAWNLVCIEGEYYYVDVTWGDPSNGKDAIYTDIDYILVNYDYLNITTQMLLEDHIVSQIIPMPECTSIEYNYYNQEQMYYDKYDEELFKKRFQQRKADGYQYLTMKFSDTAVLNKYKEELIEKQRIFDIVDEIHKAQYRLDEERLLLVLSLNIEEY